MSSLPATSQWFEIRLGCVEDDNFVFSSWIKSYRSSCLLVADEHYSAGQTALVEHLVKTARGHVYVAVPFDSPNTILGWVCRRGPVVHYIYVKEAFRRLGVGTALAGDFEHCTHLTPYGQIALKGRKAVYNPYLLMAGDQ